MIKNTNIPLLAEEPNTPRSEKSRRTQKRLLDATAKIMCEKGFSGTRLADISKAAGVPTSAIYYYYSSREDLISAVMCEGATAVHRNLEEALQSLPKTATAKARIYKAVEAHLRVELEVSDYSRAIIRNANQLPDAISHRALILLRQYNALWRQLIEAAHSEGLLRQDLNLPIAKMLILGAMNWAVEWFDDEDGDINEVVQTAQAMVWNAIAPD